MNQRQFAEYFSIPLRTLENWIGNSQANKHKCPEYLLELMEYKLRHEGFTFYHCSDGDEYGTSERVGGRIIQ